MKTGWLTESIIGAVAAVLVIMIYARFRRDMRAARKRLRGDGSQVIETGCGPIEYATDGEGDPVLVVHGVFGGFDQGLVIARGNIGDRFHSIVSSRYGTRSTTNPLTNTFGV